eukprot:TRINITY_DN16394_c0_g1_i1.p1 TRINITY_DN16394_c0_g1~~TRINITY_DN16394_c0_g1_i1.p1  ORF type:complete len:100 (+),score=12.38 TRINITY_DN16394_c0_g1_i1:246-545(+)
MACTSHCYLPACAGILQDMSGWAQNSESIHWWLLSLSQLLSAEATAHTPQETLELLAQSATSLAAAAQGSTSSSGGKHPRDSLIPVSYTHLTLPTIYSV